MIQHQITHTTTSSSSSPLTGSYSQVGSAEAAIDVTLPAGSTNVLVAAAYGAFGTTAGKLVSIEIIANQNCTIKTNSSSSPQETINLVAGVPLQWDISSYLTCPFAGAVTAWYVTATPAARLQARILTA